MQPVAIGTVEGLEVLHAPALGVVDGPRDGEQRLPDCGSQQLGRVGRRQRGADALLGVPDDDSLRELVRMGRINECTGPPGTVVVFDCNVMHGSNGNITPFPRHNVFLVYNAVSNALGEPRTAGPRTPAARAISTARLMARIACGYSERI